LKAVVVCQLGRSLNVEQGYQDRAAEKNVLIEIKADEFVIIKKSVGV
jgi:hypothetical protein